MGSFAVAEMPHAVCIPFQAQGHINPMLKLAKLLYRKGFHITFVNTEFNHNVFRDLLTKLNNSPSSPPVTCIVSDGALSFTLQAADELGIPEVLFRTTSACGFMAYFHYKHLVESGFAPLKDENYLTNGYLDTPINSIPGMRNISLRDIPTFIRTTDVNEFVSKFLFQETERAKKASGIIINTFHTFEREVLDAMKPLMPHVYSIVPLQMLTQETSHDGSLNSLGGNLWTEDEECIKWLDSKLPNSVVYVNFGSIAVMSAQQFIKFAWGLANNKHHFLWVIRPDLVRGEGSILSPKFITETNERSLISSWCPQEEVLKHPSIGEFLTQWMELNIGYIMWWCSCDIYVGHSSQNNKQTVDTFVLIGV